MTASVRNRVTPLPADEWREHAVCGGMETAAVFFVEDDKAGPAKAVCATCPARAACLDWAITTRQLGIWGGATERERERIRRRRRGTRG